MVRLDCLTIPAGDQTLVAAVVENDDGRPCRVRLADRTGGPVRPPTRNGVQVAGWDGKGITLDLPAATARAVGYASLGDPREPPVAVEAIEPKPHMDSTRPEPATDQGTTPAGVIRALGEPRPPRDAGAASRHQPAVTGSTPAHANADEDATTLPTVPGVEPPDAPATGATPSIPSPPDPPPRPDGPPAQERTEQVRAGAGPTRSQQATGVDDDETETRLADVQAALAETEARIERAERLADVSDLPEATDRMADAGGVAAIQALSVDIDRDVTALSDLARRAERLAARAEAVDLPIRTLRRLA